MKLSVQDPVFDTEQWTWRRAYDRTDFGGLSNIVYCLRNDKDVGQVMAVVPTEFLTYLRQVHNVEDLSMVSLYLDTIDRDRWAFGFVHPDLSMVDLWHYRTLPKWVDPDVRSEVK